MIIRQMRFEDSLGIARVHTQTWQTTYRGIVPEDYLDALQVEERQKHWVSTLSTPAPDTFGYVAENEENSEIAGFIHGGTTRNPELPYRGELYAIYILKDYQQHGLGRRLIQALVRDLLRAGMPDMFLWVMEANHASRRFYAALGGHYIKTNTFEINGVPINECAYGWIDLSLLAQDKSL